MSLIRDYCIGIVAINKKLNEDSIEVFPIENAAHLSGELNDKWDEINVTGYDAEGDSYQSKTKFTRTITAKWLSMNDPNRLIPPDVRRGDKVRIYQIGDSQAFFWATLDNYDRVRRLETVAHGYSATKKENVPMNPDNTYLHGISTHEKMCLLLHTSMDNEEEYKYDIFVDTKNYHVVIKDQIENRIVLKSKEELIRLETTKCQSFIQLDKKRITSKGKWYHQGEFSVKTRGEYGGGVYDDEVRLATHTHKETQKTTLPPDKTGQPWNPHQDELVIDYRQPELLR